MTKDQDHNTFQVVLIDLRKAANFEIHCVKKPLTDQLKYVALSYRWGELEEIVIDTRVGYLASITSFALHHFHKLCKAIRNEPTMASIDYVWVDAICVNQSNHEERKATIYHMSDIYALASLILAVPDLHAKHLKAMHQTVMRDVNFYGEYLYYLLQGNIHVLYKLDNKFLDDIGTPTDTNLRQLLKKYTDSFADSFMTPATLNYCYDHVHIIQHLYNNNNKSDKTELMDRHLRSLPDMEMPHQCDEMDCPLKYFHDMSKKPALEYRSWQWARCILERRTAIYEAMYFLTALVVDWSSRVWVISEFHISKKKNNLKFWFNQLDLCDTFSFFTFDIHDPRFATIQNTKKNDIRRHQASGPVYITFYQRLIHQLNRQTFFEMMLKSKASKNEDRFHAIFPFFPQYKHLLQNEDFGNTNSLLDVKLKLYKVMTNKDRLLLLYLLYNGTRKLTLPTFATPTIHWRELDKNKHVDLAATIDITLLYQDTLGHYLRVKPTSYVIIRDQMCVDEDAVKTLNRLLHPKTLRNDRSWTFVDAVILLPDTPIVLVGSFNNNTWLVSNGPFNEHTATVEEPDADFPGFHVY